MSDRELSASYHACRMIVKNSGSNFARCFCLLPKEKRRGMEVLYAFFRLTDDLSDNENDTVKNTERLSRWRQWTEQFFLLGQEPISTVDFPETAIFPALADVVRTYTIDPNNLLAVIDGCLADCTGSVRMETQEAALEYCDQVASAVGMATLAVLGLTVPLNDEIRRLAYSCGRAFQWTNFLRDVREDFSRNRCYFPMSDFSAAGLEPVSLYRLFSSGKKNRKILSIRLADSFDPLNRFFRIQFDRTTSFYTEANQLISFISPDSSRMFRLMIQWYGAIFQKIERNPLLLFDRRVRLSFWEKLRILLFQH